jgi:pyrophosphatase PpaX
VPARLSTVLFDLDGTLIDSIELIRQSLHHTLVKHRGQSPPADSWFKGLGTPLRTQFRAFTSDPAEIEAMFVTYQEHNRLHHDALLKEYPGALKAVLSLKSRGLKLGIVTSKLKIVAERGLARCGYDGVFDVLVASDDVTKHKPDPTPVLHALKLLGEQAGTAMYVGDSPHDITAGRSAGVRTAAALWGPFSRSLLEPTRPDFWLTRPEKMATLA